MCTSTSVKLIKCPSIALRSISGHRWEGSGLQLRFIPRALNDIAEILHLEEAFATS